MISVQVILAFIFGVLASSSAVFIILNRRAGTMYVRENKEGDVKYVLELEEELESLLKRRYIFFKISKSPQ
jgi:hypothetical protein